MFEYASSYRLPRELEQGMLDGFNWHFDAYFESGERISSSGRHVMPDGKGLRRIEKLLYQAAEAITNATRDRADNTPLLPRADGKGGVSPVGIFLRENYQLIVGQDIPDGVGKRNRLAVIDGRDIDASILELVDEGLVVIGTHGKPASILDLGIEHGY